jgi:hypothetical protein
MDTAEHDVVNAGESESSDDGNSAVARGEKPRSFFADQLFSIFVASLLVLAVVWISYKWGYHTPGSKHVREVHVGLSMPPWVYVPLLGVSFAGYVSSSWAEIKERFAGSFGNDTEEGQAHREFKPLPEWLLQLLVYVLTGVIVFALLKLVALSGGFTDSPFNELMTAPAVVGAFMAWWKWTPVHLTAVGIFSVWLSIKWLDFSSPHTVNPDLWVGVPKEQMHDPIPLVASSWVYGLIAVAMLVLAGGLSYYRHTRKPPKSPEQRTLSLIFRRRFSGSVDETD